MITAALTPDGMLAFIMNANNRNRVETVMDSITPEWRSWDTEKSRVTMIAFCTILILADAVDERLK